MLLRLFQVQQNERLTLSGVIVIGLAMCRFQEGQCHQQTNYLKT